MEELRRPLTEQEMDRELSKEPKEIDFDELLNRAGSRDNIARVHHFLEYELRQMPRGDEKWREAVREYFAWQNDADSYGAWWLVRRTNELMGSPLKLARLTGRFRPERPQ